MVVAGCLFHYLLHVKVKVKTYGTLKKSNTRMVYFGQKGYLGDINLTVMFLFCPLC